MNLELKMELIRHFGSQIVAARELGIGESRLSHIVRGHVRPNDRERQALEGGLGKALVQKVLKTVPAPAPEPTQQQPAA